MISNPLKHFNRHRQMIALLYKYSRSDLIQKSGLAEQFEEATPSSDEADVARGLEHRRASLSPSGSDSEGDGSDSGTTPEDLARDLESMGPAFIKLGQLLSTRPDFLPAPYLRALSRLQDDAEPIETSEVYEVIKSELGKYPEDLFESFDIEPLATASLGQVHRARTVDGGEVVVKVQRPGIATQLHDDVEAMEELASLCEHFEFGRKFQLKHLVETLKQSLEMEIDYRQEFSNSMSLANNLERFERIRIPLPIESLSTRRVITMEYIHCEKITELDPDRIAKEHAEELAAEFFEAFLYQVLVHGSFHADPHPGNVGLTSENQVVLMDHGLVVNVAPRLRANLIKLLLAICEGDGSKAAEIAQVSGWSGDTFDAEKFRMDIERIVAENVDRSVDQMEAGNALMSIQHVAGTHDLYLPREVILLGRALLHLERVVSTLDPDFDPNAAIRHHAMNIMRQHSGEAITLTTLYQTLMESAEFAQRLPERANKVAELIATNGLEFKVHTIDEKQFISGLNKVANRIASGLIISAMIVAAALMMRLETTWTVFGYPAIAFGFLTMAAIAGFILVWRVIAGDRNKRG